MGAVFLILFMIVLLGLGLAGIVCGVIGLIVGRQRRKKNQNLPKILTVVFSVVLSIGFVIASIPVGFFSFIAIVNTLPPEGFVKTDIVIEEDGYQDTRFTADGIVYEVLDFSVYDIDAMTTPVFTYYTSGFLNGARCGNYFTVENGQGFSLVCSEYGALFCPAGEKEEVIAYYTDVENLYVRYGSFENGYEILEGQDAAGIEDFLDLDLTALSEVKVVLEEPEEFRIELFCKEELIYVNEYWFVILNGKVYYEQGYDFTEDDEIEYTLFELPSEIADALLAIHENS